MKSEYDRILEQAKQYIKENNMTKALITAQSAIAADCENAAAYNLVGVIFEKTGKRKKAAKFYRIAYYVDQGYAAASINLSRVTEFGQKNSCACY